MSAPDNIAGYRIVQRIVSDPRGEIAIATPEQAPRFADTVVLRISPLSVLGSEVSVRDYMRRAALYATLSHSSILQAYEISTVGESVVLVLEHTEGLALDDLRSSLDTLGLELSDDLVLYIGLRIFGALTAAHAARDPGDGSHTPVVHGNVRPECVLVPWDGYVRLAEFEVARISAVWRGAAAAQRPTPSRYMAPEQVNSGLASIKTDVYSAALILWELLTKRLALPATLSGSSLARAMAKPKFAPLSQLRPDLPEPLLKAMDRALAPGSAQRTISASEMLTTLRELTRGDHAEGKLLPLLERVRSGRITPTPRDPLARTPQQHASLQDMPAAVDSDAGSAVDDDDLLEEAAESVNQAVTEIPRTPPPFPPPRPRLSSTAVLSAPQQPPPLAPPAPLHAGIPEAPTPLLEPIPGSERAPRLRESSGRIGLLEWSSPSNEIPAAPPPFQVGVFEEAIAPEEPALTTSAASDTDSNGDHLEEVNGAKTTPAPAEGLAQTLALVDRRQLHGGEPASSTDAFLALGQTMPLHGVTPPGEGSNAPPPLGSFQSPLTPPGPIEIDHENVVPPSIAEPKKKSSRLWPFGLVALLGIGFGTLAFYYVNSSPDRPPTLLTDDPVAPLASGAVIEPEPAPSAGAAEPEPTPSASAVAVEPEPAPSATSTEPEPEPAPSASAVAVEPEPAPSAVATATEPEPPAAEEPKPAVEAPAKPPAANANSKLSTLDASEAVGNRRIWVDGKLVAQTGQTVQVACGTRTLKVGSRSAERTVVFPCGDTFVVR